jgi:hypothetical protein
LIWRTWGFRLCYAEYAAFRAPVDSIRLGTIQFDLGSKDVPLPNRPLQSGGSGCIAMVIGGTWRSRRNEELMAVQDQDSFRQAQAELEPKEDLTPYMGKWVALRSGRVVASDLSAKGLRDNPEVRPTDSLIPVPRSRAGYFIA